MKGVLVAIALALFALGGWVWWSGDVRQIEREFAFIVDRVEKGPAENPLAAALAGSELASKFADPFFFRARQFNYETRDRQSLIRTIGLYRGRSETIVVDTVDKRIDLGPGPDQALMVVAVRFQGGWWGRDNEIYRFRIDWVQTPDGWRVRNVDLDEILPPVGR